MLQLALGETEILSCVKREGFPNLLLQDQFFTLFMELGLQFRLNNHFSLGASIDTGIYPNSDALDAVARAAQLQEGGDARLQGSLALTFHF